MRAACTAALLIGVGGFVGALLRFAVSGVVQRQLPLSSFPIGTLAVNVSGCLLIGAFLGVAESRQSFSPELRTFALIGLLGGFTTYSTFGWETFAMLRDGEQLRAATNVLLQLALGLGAVWLGYGFASTR